MVTWPMTSIDTLLWGSTVGYPSDSLASVSFIAASQFNWQYFGVLTYIVIDEKISVILFKRTINEGLPASRRTIYLHLQIKVGLM